MVFNVLVRNPTMPIRPTLGVLGVGLTISALLLGCSPAPAPSQTPASPAAMATVELCDGTPVTFDQAPDKIATGNTAALELLIRLGAGDKVVGTAWSDGAKTLPEDVRSAAEKVPSLGARAADKEKLLQSGAQVYVDPYDGMTMMGVNGPTEQDFEAAGMQRIVLRSSACTATLTTAVTTLDGVKDDIRSLAAVVDRKADGDKLVESMNTDPVPADAKRPKVLYLTAGRSTDQASTIGNRQIGNAVIDLAGGTNVFASVDKPQFPSAWEDVVASDPDIIVAAVTRQSSQKAVDQAHQALIDQLKKDSRTSGMRAVREERFFRAYAEEMTLPGVENAETARSLSRELNKIK